MSMLERLKALRRWEKAMKALGTQKEAVEMIRAIAQEFHDAFTGAHRGTEDETL